MLRRSFKYGEKIIKQGDKPKSMGIIYKGSCLAVEERSVAKNIFSSEYQTRLKGVNLVDRLDKKETKYFQKTYDFKRDKDQYTFIEYVKISIFFKFKVNLFVRNRWKN
jgi:hypothetical protein